MKTGSRIEDIGGGLSVEVSPDHGFGEDGLLLARFASPRPDDLVCDLGTGCGIIPLYWCRKSPSPKITAVEIQKDAAAMAQRSVLRCGMEEQISVIEADLRDWKNYLSDGTRDVVTMNPPYFTPGSGGISRSAAARIARHEGEGCTLAEAAQAASGMLRMGGRFCLCHRPERLFYVLDVLKNAGMEPERLRFVHATPHSPPWLFLCEGRKGGSSGISVLAPFIRCNSDGSATTEQLELYKL